MRSHARPACIVSCPARDFLEARIELEPQRIVVLDPTLDLESLRKQSRGFPDHLQGRTRRRADRPPLAARAIHWLVAPRSAVIQTSPAHSGRCDDPVALMEHLLATMVRVPRP